MTFLILEDPFLATYVLNENGVLQRWSLWFKYGIEMQIEPKNKGRCAGNLDDVVS